MTVSQELFDGRIHWYGFVYFYHYSDWGDAVANTFFEIFALSRKAGRQFVTKCSLARVSERFASRTLRIRIPLISERTIFYLKKRWGRPSEPVEEDKEYARPLTIWADYTHLLYASTISISPEAMVGMILGGGSHSPYWPLRGIGICFLLSGFISDWRLHSVEDSLCELTTDFAGGTAG